MKYKYPIESIKVHCWNEALKRNKEMVVKTRVMENGDDQRADDVYFEINDVEFDFGYGFKSKLDGQIYLLICPLCSEELYRSVTGRDYVYICPDCGFDARKCKVQK